MAKRKVIWTETSRRQRRFVLEYWLHRNGAPDFSIRLLKIISDRVKIIAKYPNSFRLSQFKDTRVSVFGHYSIFYKITDTQIIITGFWDNRQDPEGLLTFIANL